MPVDYPGRVDRDTWEKHGERPSVGDWQAVPDGKELTLSVTSGSADVTAVLADMTGTITAFFLTVTGVGTAFRSELQVGYFIQVGSEAHKIKKIVSDTSLQLFDEFISTVSGATFKAGHGFSSPSTADPTNDVGKAIVIFGGGDATAAGADPSRDTYLTDGTGATGTTDTYEDLVPIDAQGATRVVYAGNAEAQDCVWEVFGATLPDYSDEVSVHGPQDLVRLETSVAFDDSAPAYRYYRAKVKSKVSGQPGVAYVTAVAFGYVFGSTIVSVTSPTQATVANLCTGTRDSCWSQTGTVNDVFTQEAIDAATSFTKPKSADGGMMLDVTRGGFYLIKNPIDHRATVILDGKTSAGSIFLCHGSAFPENVPVWNMTGTFPSDSRIAFATRLKDIRIHCGHVPDSIAVLYDALQEHSGMIRPTLIGWRKKAVQVSGTSDRFGSANSKLVDPWAYPSNTAILDDTVIGLDIDYAPNITLSRGTILAQAGFVCGYGTCISVDHGILRAFGEIHLESAKDGFRFGTEGGGFVLGGSSNSTVLNAFRLQSGNPVKILNFVSASKYSIVDEISGASSKDAYISEFDATRLPKRTRGNNSGPDLEQWIPGSYLGGRAGLRINRRSVLLAEGGKKAFPNVLGFGAGPNFSGTSQGGWITANAEMGIYPNWLPTSGWTFSVDPTIDTLTLLNENGDEGHEFANGDTCELGSLGALPSGLADATTYYVINADQAAGTLQLSLTSGGSAIDITDTGGVDVLFIATSLRAGWYRHGATRSEFRVGRVPNTDGTDPGALVFRSDGDAGNYNPWLYFDDASVGPTEFGNKFDVNRMRLKHGQTGQSRFSVERSVNSGGAWTDDLFRLLIDLGASQLFWLFFDDSNPLKLGNNYDVNRARISHGTTAQALLDIQRSANSGASWNSGIKLYLDDGSIVFASPIFPMAADKFQAGIYQGSGTPEGSLPAAQGSTYHDTVGAYYVKTSGGSTSSGWSSVDADMWLRVSISAIRTNNSVGINRNPDTGFDLDVNGLSKFIGAIRIASVTAGQLLRADSNKDVISGKADVTAATDIKATGIPDGNLIKWDNTAGAFVDAGPPGLDPTGMSFGQVELANGGGVYIPYNVINALNALDTRIATIETKLSGSQTGTNIDLTVNNKADVAEGLIQSFHT